MADNVQPDEADTLEPEDASPGGPTDGQETPDDLPPITPPLPRVPPPPGSQRVAAPASDAATGQPPAPARTRRRRSMRWVVDLVLAVLIGIGIAVLLYLVVPPAYTRVVENQAGNEAALAGLEAENATLRAEVSAALTGQDATLVAGQAARLEAEEALTARLAALETRIATLEDRVNDDENALATQSAELADLHAMLDDTTEQLDAVDAGLSALQDELPGEAELTALDRQILFIRAWQEMLRARLRLLEGNAGLAADDLERALVTLAQVDTESATADQRSALDQVTTRLQAALETLEEQPVAASNDLEVAWYTLGGLIEPVSAQGGGEAATPTPTPETTPTPTPTSTLDPTPTPGSSITPNATPTESDGS
jgi:uncharacterized coiled-coil protein SlyX